MELEIDEGGSRIFYRRPALIEPARGKKLAHQRLRHRLAGLVVERDAPQHVRMKSNAQKAAKETQRSRPRHGFRKYADT
jgi:hypothetical protein